MVKVAFIIPLVLGAVWAWIVGNSSNWFTDRWVLPLMIGAFISLAMLLPARPRAKDVGMGRMWNKWGREISPNKKLLGEVLLFVWTLVCIVMPLSARRGILIAGHQVTTRTILIVGAVLVGTSLVVSLIKRYRKP